MYGICQYINNYLIPAYFNNKYFSILIGTNISIFVFITRGLKCLYTIKTFESSNCISGGIVSDDTNSIDLLCIIILNARFLVIVIHLHFIYVCNSDVFVSIVLIFN